MQMQKWYDWKEKKNQEELEQAMGYEDINGKDGVFEQVI